MKLRAYFEQRREPPSLADLNAIPQPSEVEKNPFHSRPSAGARTDNFNGLEKELLDLKILNRGKDYFIEQLKKEREAMLEKLVAGSHRIGELEISLRQLFEPRNSPTSDSIGMKM